MTWNLSFASMGTRAHALVDGDPELLALLARDVQHLDAIWSRFRDDSEVSRVNGAGGEPVRVSDETLDLFELSVRSWELTGGLFDPTLLNEVIAAGYDRDFDQVRDEGPGPARDVPRRLPTSGAGIQIDRDASTVSLPAGVAFDSGGLGKGHGAELIAKRMVERGANAVLLNLGGDLFAAGAGPAEGWTIDLDNPFGGRVSAASVRLREGALATSMSHTRSWMRNGRLQHHIIDPRTGRPSGTDAASATVVCDRGWKAEAYAKAALLAGWEPGCDLLAGAGIEGMLVSDRGDACMTPGFEHYLQGPANEIPNLRKPRTMTITLPNRLSAQSPRR